MSNLQKNIETFLLHKGVVGIKKRSIRMEPTQAHAKKSRHCMLAMMVPEGEGESKVLRDVPQVAHGAIVVRRFKPWGCTKCSCIAFRLEEARLLR